MLKIITICILNIFGRSLETLDCTHETRTVSKLNLELQNTRETFIRFETYEILKYMIADIRRKRHTVSFVHSSRKTVSSLVRSTTGAF